MEIRFIKQAVLLGIQMQFNAMNFVGYNLEMNVLMLTCIMKGNGFVARQCKICIVLLGAGLC